MNAWLILTSRFEMANLGLKVGTQILFDENNVDSNDTPSKKQTKGKATIPTVKTTTKPIRRLL